MKKTIALIIKIIFRLLGLPFIAGLALISTTRDYIWFLIRWMMYGGVALAWSKQANSDDIRELLIELKKQTGSKQALQNIIELGRKDLSNPKYDSYFEEARQILK